MLMLTRPHNIFDGHPYTAAHIVAAPTEFRSEHGSSSWGFCTFRQAKDHGWHVQDGETGCRVNFEGGGSATFFNEEQLG